MRTTLIITPTKKEIKKAFKKLNKQLKKFDCFKKLGKQFKKCEAMKKNIVNAYYDGYQLDDYLHEFAMPEKEL